jgi:hypothetical protein
LNSFDWKYRFQNSASDSFVVASIQHKSEERVTKAAYFIWDIIAICLGYNRVLFKDVMDELWGYDDFWLAPVGSLRSWIDKLTWSSPPLTFRSCLS